MQQDAPKPRRSTPSPIAPITATDVPVFYKEKHISYWLRCLRSPLPTAYTSNSSNRVTLAFFTVSALDLLGVLFTRTTELERREYLDWLYRCQHPNGGFCGFPRADHPGEAATVPATYFALSSLCVLGDDLDRVRRGDCLKWLKKMQRPSGSFGELLGEHDAILGGTDSRFGYCAMCVRWILRGHSRGTVGGAEDIDIAALIECIQRSETYDGGIADEPFHEAHAGFTYCAIGALSLVDRLSSPRKATPASAEDTSEAERAQSGLRSPGRATQWLLARLTTCIEEDEFEEDDEPSPTSSQKLGAPPTIPGTPAPYQDFDRSFSKIRSAPAHEVEDNKIHNFSALDIPSGFVQVCWLGFNGRSNKVADTCYVWWAGASLKMLGALQMIDIEHVRAYLLERTQHLVAGGFGKFPGDPPDIYHAYLGLASLALIDGHRDEGATIGPGVEDASKASDVDGNLKADGYQDGFLRRESDSENRILRSLDPALCFSAGTRRWVESFEWRKGNRT